MRTNKQNGRREVILPVDAITKAAVPVMTVARITDASLRGARPVILNQSVFWIEGDAEAFAREQSALYPAPQRLVIYDENLRYVAAWQCGKPLSPFTLVGA